MGFDLPVDNLKTGKVRNTFPTTYAELDIFQGQYDNPQQWPVLYWKKKKSVYHTSQGGELEIFFTRERVVSKRGRVGGGRVVLIPSYISPVW